MDIKLSQLGVLVAVADAGSFSAAALELECTQSRISHAIAELEMFFDRQPLAVCAIADSGPIHVTLATRHLRIVEEHEHVAGLHFGEVAAPRRVVRLMNCDSHVARS